MSYYAPPATQMNSNLDYVKELEKENQLLIKNNGLLQKQTANNTAQIGRLDEIVEKLLGQHSNVSSSHPLPSAEVLSAKLQPVVQPDHLTFEQWQAMQNHKAAPVQVNKPIPQQARQTQPDPQTSKAQGENSAGFKQWLKDNNYSAASTPVVRKPVYKPVPQQQPAQAQLPSSYLNDPAFLKWQAERNHKSEPASTPVSSPSTSDPTVQTPGYAHYQAMLKAKQQQQQQAQASVYRQPVQQPVQQQNYAPAPQTSQQKYQAYLATQNRQAAPQPIPQGTSEIKASNDQMRKYQEYKAFAAFDL